MILGLFPISNLYIMVHITQYVLFQMEGYSLSERHMFLSEIFNLIPILGFCYTSTCRMLNIQFSSILISNVNSIVVAS